MARWDKAPHLNGLFGSDEGYDWQAEISADVTWQQIYIATANGEPVGVIIVLDPSCDPTGYWGDLGPNVRAIDLWIGEPDWLGKGVGTQMMRKAIDMYRANEGVTTFYVDPLISNERAHRFYERLGFRRIDQRRFGEDECYVYRRTIGQ